VAELGSATETHFQLDIVADCFAGMTLVQRHKMIYTLLAQEMGGGVHALSIRAKTTEEIGG
jgi:stress-induced morphogen